MATDYSWFEETLGQRKRYRLGTTWHRYYADLLEQGTQSKPGLPMRKWFEVTRRNPYEEYIEIEGEHSMNPGVPTGAEEIEDVFQIKLNTDIHDFYKQWGGGFLMLCEFYYLLSPTEVVHVSNDFRESRGEKNLPWDVFRICDVGNGNCIGMQKFNSEWRVVFLSIEYSDEMILNDRDLVKSSILGMSFLDWLKGTIERDGEFGVPGLGSPWYKDGPAAYERLE